MEIVFLTNNFYQEVFKYQGREQILLNEIKVQNYASSKFTRISTKMNTDKVKNLLLKT